VLDVGMAGQVRAGRQLVATDFTALGLSAPRGLWNLSDLTDASGNGRALVNKGAVTFANGINGAATTAAQFTGSTAQALYILDNGTAADPFRITTGSWGCWFRTAKRGTVQELITKSQGGSNRCYELSIATGNQFQATIFQDGASTYSVATGVSDVADDRWHLGVVTHDGTMVRLYVDGVLEATTSAAFLVYVAAVPLNIGARQADATTAPTEPHYGRVDEAFVTADVLSDDQVRALYCARIPHTLGLVPSSVKLNVTRRRRGGAWAVADFPTQPLRLHNFTAGSLADQGSNATALTVAAGTPASVAGADGTLSNGYHFNGAASLGATDALLPSALATRSYGCWFKTTSAGSSSFVVWGTLSTADVRLWVNGGSLQCASGTDNIIGPFVADGQWHLAVAVEDNTLAPGVGDGVKRKLYLDGRLVAGSTVLNAIGGAGAQPRFRVGANPDGSGPFTGQVDGVFVTDAALSAAQIAALWAKGAQALAPSPKNAGDHVEAWDATSVLATFDTLDTNAQVDLGVAA
jgi:hypothetical protein